jgi:uracil-DNA glycosylase family 4
MTESFDPDLAALADLAGEIAELLRFEHDAGAIGVVSLAVETAAPPSRAEAPPKAAASAREAPSSAEPALPERVAAPKIRAAAAQAGRPVEVSMGEIDALLAQAKRARTAPAPPAEASPPPAAAPAPSQAVASSTSSSPVRDDGRLTVLAQLASDAAACTACRLHESRTKSVFSRGSASAEIVFVGEGPGFNEDKKGEPFVGAAGQLLDKMVSAMGLARDAVYICNVVKCRPPENRTPLPDEAAACGSFLDGQLAAIKPRVIVALGRCAAERLGCAEAGRSWRGSWGEYRGVPVMPTYHPAFLLRNAEMKRPVWEDLQKVTTRLTTLRGGAA